MKQQMICKISSFFCLAIVIFGGGQGLFAKDKETRITIENDGWKLAGDLLIPESKKLVPAVILINKANGNRRVYKKIAKHLAENRIASLRLDLRGHGESINKGKFHL
jgi:alpha-beta hydrolase superfamily lysophospholipase